MNDIAIIVEYMRSMPWASSVWAWRLATALASRGARVRILCDGAEDPGMAPAGDAWPRIEIRRPWRRLRASDPIGFGSWAARRVLEGPGASISLTRLAPGDLWFPLSPPILSVLSKAVRVRSPVTAALELLHRPWAPLAVYAERRAAWLARRWPGVPAPAIESLASSGLAGMVEPPAEADRPALRDRVRSLLGIPRDHVVFITSGVHTERPGIRESLDGFSRAVAGSGDPVQLLVFGRKTHTLRRLCDQAGLGARARIMGGTFRLDAALAASDAGIVLGARADATSTGRFLADCLRMSVPVVCSSAAVGASIVQGASGAGAGIVVDDTTHAETWRRGVEWLLDPDRRRSATSHAREAGSDLSMDALATRLLDRLSGRKAPRGKTHGAASAA